MKGSVVHKQAWASTLCQTQDCGKEITTWAQEHKTVVSKQSLGMFDSGFMYSTWYTASQPSWKQVFPHFVKQIVLKAYTYCKFN